MTEGVIEVPVPDAEPSDWYKKMVDLHYRTALIIAAKIRSGK